MSEINLPGAETVIKTAKTYARDLAERTIATAAKKLWFQARAITLDGAPVKLLHRVASGPYWAAS